MQPIQALIPHSGPMLLIDQLVQVHHSQKSGQVTCNLKTDKPYWDNQKCFRSHWLLEIMAQAAAALFGALDQEMLAGSPHPGVLLSIREWSLEGSPKLIVGDQLTIFVWVEAELDAMRQAHMKLYREQVLLCEAFMSFYQTPRSGVS